MLAVLSCGRVEAQSSAAKTEPVAEKTAEEIIPVKEMPKQAPAEEKPVQTPEPQQPAAEQPQVEQKQEIPADEGCTVEANGLKLEVKSATVEKDYNGQDMVVVMILFTNNNSYEEQYWNIGSDSASQNGAPLRSDIPFEGEKFFNSAVAISNGQSVPIYVPYGLADPNAKVDFTVRILNPNNGQPVASNSCSLTLQ